MEATKENIPLKAENETQRFEEITTTLHALVIVVKNKLGVTESEWSQAVDGAKNRR